MEAIQTIRKTRQFLLDTIKDLSAEQINTIPQGFSNNIIWHLGHMVAAQQGVCYIRAGIAPVLDQAFIDRYKSGTKPEHIITDQEIGQIKGLMFSSLDQLQQDYDQKAFEGYTAWSTRYGNTISNIQEAIDFLPFHEGMHIGYIMAFKKLIGQPAESLK